MKKIFNWFGLDKIFNWLYCLILDETSKLPSSRKVISFVFTVLSVFIVALVGYIVNKIAQGHYKVTPDILRALDILKGLLYICCGMILLLLSIVTMQQLINFRTSSIYNSPAGVAPVDNPAPTADPPKDPEQSPTDPNAQTAQP